MKELSSSISTEQLIQRFGIARTVSICLKTGGVRIYVPSRERIHPKVTAARYLKTEELLELADTWGRSWLWMPMGRSLCVCYLSQIKGLTGTRIARILRCHEATIRKILRAKPYDLSKAPPAKQLGDKVQP